MARPREFDLDDAVTKATGLFWDRGYEGTSLQDLLSAMGIARGSLYKAFKDKKAIYLAALDQYAAGEIASNVAFLRDTAAGTGAERIAAFFGGIATAVEADNDRRGCFLCNAAIDQANADPDIRARVISMMDRLKMALEVGLADVLPAKGDRQAVATLLLNAYMGLRVLARAGYPAADLRAVAVSQLKLAGVTV